MEFKKLGRSGLVGAGVCSGADEAGEAHEADPTKRERRPAVKPCALSELSAPSAPSAYLIKNRFPRIRFVALSTASAAPRAESVSARKQPTRRCPFPSSV